jgi:hypothetical protein
MAQHLQPTKKPAITRKPIIITKMGKNSFFVLLRYSFHVIKKSFDEYKSVEALGIK